MDEAGLFFTTTNPASYEALPFPLFVCILLYSSPPLSFACLATLRVDFFKVLGVQLLICKILNFQYLDVQRFCR